MQKNKIYLYKDSGELLVGFFSRISSNKTYILSESGKELPLPDNKVIFTCSVDCENATKESLKSLRNRIDSFRSEFNLKDLYDLVADESNGFNLRELTGFILQENCDPCCELALLIAINEDKIFFKNKNEIFYPRSPAEVNETLSQISKKRAAEEKKLHDKSLALEKIKVIISGCDEPVTTEVLNYINPLKEYAIHGSNESSANEIICELEKLGVIKKKDLFLNSFEILVKLRVFSEDENLDLYRHNVHKEFTEAQIGEVKRLVDSHKDDGVREDLTGLTAFSVDDESTMDIDDALAVEIAGDKYKFYVFIADVASVIGEGSLLDVEAFKRSSSIYLPSGKIPMLPVELSENLLSLKSGCDRTVLCYEFICDSSFNILEKNIKKALINVKYRLSYTQAADICGMESGHELIGALRLMSDFASKLKEIRIGNGGFILDGDDISIHIKEGEPIRIERCCATTAAHTIVREMMILANYTSSNYTLKNGLNGIFVYQYAQNPSYNPPKHESLSRHERFEVLCNMKKSEIGIVPHLHYSLGLDSYTQATSPIRRYNDLMEQRIIINHLNNKENYDKDFLSEKIMPVEENCRKISVMERDSIRYWIYKFFSENKELILSGVVLRKLSNNLYLTELIDYNLRADLHSPQELKAGDSVELAVTDVNPRGDVLKLKIVRSS